MANIRIKDLSTTASTTASDDFFGVDGATNGTRKLNAYSPTFGGNLTVSGDVLLPTNSAYRLNGKIALLYNGSNFYIEPNNDLGNIIIGASAQTTYGFTVGGNLTVSGTGVGLTIAPSSGPASLTLNGAAAGSTVNFAVTGTNKYTAEYVNGSDFFAIGRSGVAYDLALKSGNLLVGTTTDSANGKLQLATHITSAGGIGFGTDLSLYRGATGLFAFNDTSGAADTRLFLYNSGTLRGAVEAYGLASAVYIGAASAGWSTYVTSGNQAIALTLDTSQNATFAGSALVKSFVTLAGATSGTSFLHWKETSVADRGVLGFEAGSSTLKYRSGGYSMATGTEVFSLTSGGNATFAGSLTTAAPSGGTAGAWKLGVRVAATTTLDTTQYLQVDIGGTLYKVALVTS